MCVLTLLRVPLIAQDTQSTRHAPLPDSLFSVDSVFVRGNELTKHFVILREMTLMPGGVLTQERVSYDQNRIYSLGLFNRVEITPLPSTPGKVHLIVDVSERWYLFPYPIFGIKDRDWGKVFYGVGLVHTNFRGRNEKISTSIILGFDPSLRFTYRNPFLNAAGTDFLEAGLGVSKVRNRSLAAQQGIDNFDERHFSASLAFGKRVGIEHTFFISAGYEIVDIPDVLSPRTLSPNGKDVFPFLKLGYSLDTRDLAEYAGYGTYARVNITKYGLPGHDVDIVRYGGDLRKFIPLVGGFVLTGRVFTELTYAGPTPGYNRVFFGFGERIRGHFRDVMEGERMVGVSSELHYLLLRPVYFQVGMLPSQFGLWRFGVSVAAFADAGTAWFRSEPLALDKFARGYGVGLHFMLPYSFVIRTEYALNEVRRGEFIFDVGASF